MIKNMIAGLAEVGKIKIGKKGQMKKTKTGKEFRMPEKHDHFTITTIQRDQNDDFVVDTKLMEQVAEATEQEATDLKEIPVRLLYDDIDLNFRTSYACYKGTKCWCRGDGEKAIREGKEIECPCEKGDPAYNGRDKCKPNGCLSVVIDGAELVGGAWKFRTTSYNSVKNILSSLAFIKQITQGQLAGLPLSIVVRPKAANIPSGGTTTVYVVGVEYHGPVNDLIQIGYEEAERRAIGRVKMDEIENEARKMLDYAPTEKEVAEEFYPEAVIVDEETGEVIPEEGSSPYASLSFCKAEIEKITDSAILEAWYMDNASNFGDNSVLVIEACKERKQKILTPPESKECPNNGEIVTIEHCQEQNCFEGCPAWN